MPRSRPTIQKRQKEIARMERQREKAARRLERSRARKASADEKGPGAPLETSPPDAPTG